MWRVLHSIGRGLRSARPSQCYSQDCSEDGVTKYCNDISEVQTATQRHYSAASCWSPLIVKKNDNSLGGNTCKSTQVVICYPSFSQVGQGIHTGSWDNGSPSAERTVGARYQPRCPPWHWQILQDNKDVEEYCSEKEKKEEKQNKQDWKKTCHFEEWKEALHASPTLHALGWGSAAALTWSLFYGRSEHHSSQYQKNKKHHQVSYRDSKKRNPNFKDIKNQDNDNEEILIYHKPFKDLLTSESHDPENHDKESLVKMYEDLNSKSDIRPANTYKPNLMKFETQEVVLPVYSLQHKSLEKLNKWFGTQANSSAKEEYRLEDIWLKDNHLDVNESSFFLEDKWFDVQEKSDSGCNQSFQSQTDSTKPEFHNQCNQTEENVVRTVSDTISACDVLETSEYEESAGEEKDEHEPYHFREYHQPINNSSDDEIEVLCDRLMKIVKAHHEERMTNMVGKDKKTIFDTNPEEMIVYLQAGVLMGDTTSAFNLALCYHMGHGITQDLEKARKLYEIASAAGHGWATYNLAVMLSQESEGPFMAPKAHSLLLQAAKLGVKEAEDALSTLVEEEEQQKIQHKEGESVLRRCSSEPSLFSFHTKEWPYSYSTSDLQSLLDEDYSSVEDVSSAVNVTQKV